MHTKAIIALATVLATVTAAPAPTKPTNTDAAFIDLGHLSEASSLPTAPGTYVPNLPCHPCPGRCVNSTKPFPDDKNKHPLSSALSDLHLATRDTSISKDDDMFLMCLNEHSKIKQKIAEFEVKVDHVWMDTVGHKEREKEAVQMTESMKHTKGELIGKYQAQCDRWVKWEC